MCAIAGFNWKDEGRAAAMAADLSYRGPDARGVYADAGISLAHNRLAVIDLSPSANQPMRDESGHLIIVFNGEIYNFKELKRELEGSYPFRTHSDTEVILAGYRVWGKAVVEKLNGMFSFALWDRRTSTLFCARDRAGMKPFYYYWDGKRFIFASEMKALFTHDIERTLDQGAFNHYLRLLYVPHPQTLVKNVFALPPSCTLVLRGSSLTVAPYDVFDPHVGSRRPHMGYGEAVQELREKVQEAVERHLVADVPVGVYLSGGIDSSAVLASVSKVQGGVKTFTVGFSIADTGEQEKFNHDFELAKRTAAHFGTDHHPLIVSTSDALAAFEEVAAHNSDPISNPTGIAMLLLARDAKQHVTVALTGNAGDELFGGYDRYRMAVASAHYRKLPPFFRRAGNAASAKLAKLDQDETDLFAQFMFQKDDRLRGVVAPSVWKDADATKEVFRERYFGGTGDPVERLVETDRMSWLPDHFFMLSDKMSMASALEERMPLTDADLIHFAKSLPRSYKVDLFRTKKVLKDAFKEDLPEYLLREPKRGWFSPAAKWLRDPAWNAFAHEVLSQGYYEGTASLFDWEGVRGMLDRHISKEQYNLSIVWALLTFQAWARRHRIRA